MKGETGWTIPTLKEHFERIIADRDIALRAALAASQEAIDKAELRLNEILEGFPQEYGRKSELENLEAAINVIKADHIQRRELAELKDQHAEDVSELREAHSEGRGVRLTVSAGMGIVIALIAVALGAMYANQLTPADVSGQIARETPKPEVNARLQRLETQQILLRTQLATHEATDKLRATLSRGK